MLRVSTMLPRASPCRRPREGMTSASARPKAAKSTSCTVAPLARANSRSLATVPGIVWYRR